VEELRYPVERLGANAERRAPAREAPTVSTREINAPAVAETEIAP